MVVSPWVTTSSESYLSEGGLMLIFGQTRYRWTEGQRASEKVVSAGEFGTILVFPHAIRCSYLL
jgi:hypothetical protein